MNSGQRVLVTGGTGFLGTRVVPRLLEAGYQVRCLVRSMPRGKELIQSIDADLRPRLELVGGNLLSETSCRRLVEGCSIVVHVAAPLVGSAAALFLNGVVPTRRLIEAAASTGVDRFVLISSLSVYGVERLNAGGTLDEECEIDPTPHLRDAYAYSKIVQEQVCWEASRAGKVPLVVVRPGVLFGPGRSFLTNRVGLRIGSLLIQMGGRQRVPYTHVDNAADVVTLAVTTPRIIGMAFNVVDDEVPRARQLVRIYKREVAPLRVIRLPRPMVSTVARLCAWYSAHSDGLFPPVITPYKADALWKPLQYSNGRAKSILGWRPRINFADGLAQTIASLRTSPGAAAH